MERGLFNITSATTTTLIDVRTKQSKNISIRMTNTSQSTAVRISLFLEDDSSNKVYIANHSTDETFYIQVAIDGVIGRLYAGDWMFIPWGAVDQHDDIEITANGGTNTICYALFHEGRTLTAS